MGDLIDLNKKEAKVYEFESHDIEPKRTDRFLVKYPAVLGISTQLTHSASRPTYNFLDDTWSDITFKIYDQVFGVTTTKSLMSGIGKLKEKVDRTLTIKLFITDPTGVPVEEWDIIGEIKEVDFGSLSYSTTNFLDVKIIFKVNNAILVF